MRDKVCVGFGNEWGYGERGLDGDTGKMELELVDGLLANVECCTKSALGQGGEGHGWEDWMGF